VSWTWKAVLSPSGSVDEILSVGNDITEQKRQNDYLAQANLKMNLLGHLTRHDALNQLSVLVGWLDIALDSENREGVGKHLAKVRESAESIRAILEFTGEYERMSSSSPEWIDAKKAMREGTQALPLEGIELDCGIEGVEILGDPMLPRVFRNLIDNSIRHGQKVSKISCRYSIEGSNLVLVYEDDGVGLSDASRARVFERGIGDHSGYGLFMVKEILGMTGITISVTGSEGKGVRFEIRVPKGGYRLRPKDKR
jgi:signal transduction histidine kinase